MNHPPRLGPACRVIALVTPALLLAVSQSARANGAASPARDWPQFRGPTGQGVSDATGLPVEWSPTKNVAWKAKLPGRGWSSPVLAAGRVYLTTAVGGSDRGGGGGGPIVLRALCLDAEKGASIWDVEVFRPDPAAARALHKKNSLASATPVLAGERLYVHFGHLGTAALDPRTGAVLWRQTGITYSPVHGNGGSPALVNGDTLVFSCDGGSDPFLAGLDAATGAVRWRAPRDTHAKSKFSFSTPLVIDVNGRTQIVCPASGIVAAYDPAGRELWRVRYGEGYSVIPRPVFAHGLLFVSSGYDQPTLYAIDPAGAAGDVTESHVAWTLRKGAPNTPSPVVLGDEVYVVSDAGVATCADARTGKVHWTKRLGGGANFSASPVAADGRVYFQNEDGVGFVVKAAKTFELLAENDLGERSLASYAVAADGALFVRTDGHLWKIAAGAQRP